MTFLVHAVGHVQVGVTNVAAVVKVATELLGLHVTHQADGRTWLSSNGRAAELVLVEDNKNHARIIGLEALKPDALREASRSVAEGGCRIVAQNPSLACIEESVIFVSPEGLTFEIHTPIRDSICGRRHAMTGVVKGFERRPHRQPHRA